MRREAAHQIKPTKQQRKDGGGGGGEWLCGVGAIVNLVEVDERASEGRGNKIEAMFLQFSRASKSCWVPWFFS